MRADGGGQGAARLRSGRARPAVRRAMDFNMKKLASDAGIFFTRAVQVRPCALGLARPPLGARMWGGPGATLRESRGAQEKPLGLPPHSPLREYPPPPPPPPPAPAPTTAPLTREKEPVASGRSDRTLSEAQGRGPSRASTRLPGERYQGLAFRLAGLPLFRGARSGTGEREHQAAPASPLLPSSDPGRRLEA